MRGIVPIAASFALFTLTVGCGLSTAGLEAAKSDGGGGVTVVSGPPDATVSPSPADDASVSDDAGATIDDAGAAEDVNAVDAAEAGPVDAACPAPLADASIDAIPQAATPPTIDGNLTDWGCGPWTELDDTNAGYVREDGQILSGQFSLRWDANNVYVAAHILVPALQGSNTTAPYENDAVEIYLSGDTPLTGDYDKLSHQYIVDWHNLVVDYGPSNYPPSQAVTSPPSFTSAVKVVSGGWQVEAAIAWAALENNGKAPAANATLGFDLQLDDGDGTTLNTQVLAIFATHPAACACKTCCCGQATDYPNCDTLCFGGIALQ